MVAGEGDEPRPRIMIPEFYIVYFEEISSTSRPTRAHARHAGRRWIDRMQPRHGTPIRRPLDKNAIGQNYHRPDARPLQEVLLRVLIVASLARRPATGNPRLILPVPFGAWVF
jgi:hypothetical protein